MHNQGTLGALGKNHGVIIEVKILDHYDFSLGTQKGVYYLCQLPSIFGAQKSKSALCKA